MDFSVRPRGSGPPVRVRGRNRDAIVGMVNRAIKSGDLAIVDTVAVEMHYNAKRAFESAARRAVAAADIDDAIVEDALAKFGRLYARFRTSDIKTYLEMIDRMYADIWSDPRMADAVARWRRVKERHGMGKGRPSLGTHGEDFVILSTAAALAARGIPVKLLTFDHDIVAFAAAIRERFGVDVVDCNRL